MPDSAALLGFGVACLGVILGVIVAGTSDDAGHLVTVFFAGLWLVWLVGHPTAFRAVGNALGG